MFDIDHPQIQHIVRAALDEDIGSGDVTSELTVPEPLRASGRFIAKEAFTVAGIELLPLIYTIRGDLRGGASVHLYKKSGDAVAAGDTLATVSAAARTLLECERVALNFLQRLSGIATLAREYVNAVAGTNVKVLDTRKTIPGLRLLEKYAAAAGGATNHRQGLFDAVLIKNNHITAAGGVRAALEKVASFKGPIEIEVRTPEELQEALASGAQHLLLDNLTPPQAREWIDSIAGRATTELSGNITLENIRAYAEAGPDYISCGAITHSAQAVDISFRLEL
ncbi:MAG TPA: carboxylating nicotinate-nucleotide diphosphorylase [Bryobacteraceae bacterium]|nr:carboxylating nicotinate-nucleotide diphosphorylase [Bryobacteraceae bacterium]